MTEGETPEFLITGWDLEHQSVDLTIWGDPTKAECGHASRESVVAFFVAVGAGVVTFVSSLFATYSIGASMSLAGFVVAWVALAWRSWKMKPAQVYKLPIFSWGGTMGKLVRFQESRPTAVFNMALGIAQECEEWDRKGLPLHDQAKSALWAWDDLVDEFVDDCERLPANEAFRFGESRRAWAINHLEAKAELRQIDASFLNEMDVV